MSPCHTTDPSDRVSVVVLRRPGRRLVLWTCSAALLLDLSLVACPGRVAGSGRNVFPVQIRWPGAAWPVTCHLLSIVCHLSPVPATCPGQVAQSDRSLFSTAISLPDADSVCIRVFRALESVEFARVEFDLVTAVLYIFCMFSSLLTGS